MWSVCVRGCVCVCVYVCARCPLAQTPSDTTFPCSISVFRYPLPQHGSLAAVVPLERLHTADEAMVGPHTTVAEVSGEKDATT